MPELKSTATTTGDSVVSSQAAVAATAVSDAETAASPPPSNVSPTVMSSGGEAGLQLAAATPSAGVAAPIIPTALLSPAASKPVRDSSWLELDICRDYHKDGTCVRGEQCRFAHPDSNVVTRDGKVTCCYDFLKDRCFRERCKYFHPPTHIKERLVAAGKQYGAMMSNMFCVASGGMYPTALPMPAVQHPVMGFDGCLVASPPPPPASLSPAFVLSPYGGLTERLHICPEFARGQCSVEMCPFAHPEFHVRQNFDSTVTMCRDFIRTGCQREHCRYFHPPQHIMAQVESIINMQPMGPPQGMFIAHSPLMSPPTSFQPGPALMYSAPHPSFSLSSPIPTSSVPFYPGGFMGALVPSLTIPYTAPAAATPAAAVPISVISTNRPVGGSTIPAAARGYSHHFPMTSVVSVQSMSTQPTSFVQPPILSPISADAVSGHQVGAPQMPNLAIA